MPELREAELVRLADLAGRARVASHAGLAGPAGRSAAHAAELHELGAGAGGSAVRAAGARARRKHRAMLAAAVLAVLCGLHCAWPDRAAFDAFTQDVRAELAALPRSVPRAPRFVSGAEVLDALPDLGGAFRSLATAVESSP